MELYPTDYNPHSPDNRIRSTGGGMLAHPQRDGLFDSNSLHPARTASIRCINLHDSREAGCASSRRGTQHSAAEMDDRHFRRR